MTTARPRSAARIEQRLLSMLDNWWPVGSRLPPTNILALWLGTGQRNTHEALRELTRKGYLESRQRAGTFVVRAAEIARPRPPGLSRSLRTRPLAGLRVAIVLHGREKPPPVTAILEARLTAAGLLVERIRHKDAFSFDLTGYARPDLAGMVLVFPELYSSIRFDERTCLAVLASSRVLNIDAQAGFDYVTVDEVQGALAVGRRARELGARRPCFVGKDLPVTDAEYDETSMLRMRAFEDGVARRIPSRCQLHVRGYSPVAGQRLTEEFLNLDPLPDFVFAVTDEVAIGLMTGTAAQGVVAGRDYMLMGFDGNPSASEVRGGPLSTMRRPEEAMAHLTANFFLDRLACPDQPTRRMQMGCALEEGVTTRPIALEGAAAATALKRTVKP